MRAAILFALVLVLTPSAAAAPVTGSLLFHEAPSLEGNLTLVSESGFVDLAGSGPEPVLAWSRAEGVHEGYAGMSTGGGTGVGTSRWSTRVSAGAGALRVVECGPGCLVLLVVAEGEGEVGAEGAFAGRVSALVSPAGAPALEVERLATLRMERQEARLALSPQPDLAPFVRGRATLLLWNATVQLSGPEGDLRLTTGERTEAVIGQRVPAWRTNVSHAAVALEDARLLGGAAAITVPRLEARLEGVVSSPSASGWMEVDGQRMRLDRMPFHLLGNVVLDSSALAPDLLAPQSARGSITGEAEAVRVGGYAARWEPSRAAEAGALVVVTMLLVAVKLTGLVAFYSRLSPRMLLSNLNRERLYGLVCQRPGQSAAPLAAEAGIGRMVAQYHLRVLERHRLVHGRGTGRLRLYYPAHAHPPDASRLALERLLRNPTRRALAELVRGEAEGRTQAELAALSGESPRLVSYHLRALEKVGVVEGTQGRPRRFRATAALDDALA